MTDSAVALRLGWLLELILLLGVVGFGGWLGGWEDTKSSSQHMYLSLSFGSRVLWLQVLSS